VNVVEPEFADGLNDRYRIERELGRGGMATVLLADDVKHRRKVAIKVMHPHLAAAIGQNRFLREIEIAARLTHPHILPLFDSGTVEGRVYYVMPFIDGESLRQRIDREKQLGLRDALRLTREVASALGHAHQHGLVHRDVKPENILLADGIALVADFGIARAMTADGSDTDMDTMAVFTRTGAIVGTPRYMSPEQASGAEVDARTDIYALAAVLYEMLTGEPPLSAPTHESLVRLIASSAPRPVDELRTNVPPSVAMAVMRGLEKLPADRFPSMAQFAEALLVSDGRTPTPVAVTQQTTTPNNLPRQRSRFVGRERELAECARVLAETRLLTLTGVGGSGKTRLALRLAESMLDTYPDGVWFVDLAPVEQENILAQVVAASVGVRSDPDETPEAALERHLAGRRTMVLIDNAEHMLGTAADLADRLLSALPDLKLIVTSREGLGIGGERLFMVRSLSLPAQGADSEAATLLKSEAVRLFVMRAQEIERRFALDGTNALAVTEICRRLDGIPLALELAAARTRALSVEQIARMLDDRFRLLTGGARSALERHRTLRATVQWSYDHLEPEEQHVFQSLSVFAGGWTLDAAAAIAGVDEFDMLETLTRLIDKSLVLTERRVDGEARYRMLETLRQFGLELLASSGRADDVRRQHLEFYIRWATAMKEGLRVVGPVPELARVRTELDNLRGALTWGYREAPERAALLTRRLARLWQTAGYYTEGRGWYARTLTLGDAVEPATRAEALARSGRLAFIQGDYRASVDHYLEEASIQDTLGDERRTARALEHAGGSYSYLREHEKAFELLERSREILERCGETDRLASLVSNVSMVHFLRGDMKAARGGFEAALASAVERGEREPEQVALGNLALVDVAEGNAGNARERLRRCIATNRELDNPYGIAHDMPAMAAAMRLDGDPVTAARILGAADQLLVDIDAKLEAMERDMYESVAEDLRKELGEEAYARARTEGAAIGWSEVVDAV
jgi:non-specific serine/threonine protein kinase